MTDADRAPLVARLLKGLPIDHLLPCATAGRAPTAPAVGRTCATEGEAPAEPHPAPRSALHAPRSSESMHNLHNSPADPVLQLVLTPNQPCTCAPHRAGEKNSPPGCITDHEQHPSDEPLALSRAEAIFGMD
jgi:hypothetical protein